MHSRCEQAGERQDERKSVQKSARNAHDMARCTDLSTNLTLDLPLLIHSAGKQARIARGRT